MRDIRALGLNIVMWKCNRFTLVSFMALSSLLLKTHIDRLSIVGFVYLFVSSHIRANAASSRYREGHAATTRHSCKTKVSISTYTDYVLPFCTSHHNVDNNRRHSYTTPPAKCPRRSSRHSRDSKPVGSYAEYYWEPVSVRSSRLDDTDGQQWADLRDVEFSVFEDNVSGTITSKCMPFRRVWMHSLATGYLQKDTLAQIEVLRRDIREQGDKQTKEISEMKDFLWLKLQAQIVDHMR